MKHIGIALPATPNYSETFINSKIKGLLQSGFKVSLYVKRDRYKTEARFLNALNQSGIIGVIIDMLLIFIPGYLAVNRSNNSFSKLLGLYLFSSWPLYFLEMPLSLDLNYFFYYFVIGLCLNNSLRKSSDKQIKFFFKSI